MDINEELQQCIQAFDNGAYRDCIGRAQRLLRRGDDHALWQIILISFQRLKDTDQARRTASEFLAGTRDPWHQTLVGLTLGQVSFANVTAMAGTPDRQCQALYYAGARSYTESRLDQAVEQFDSCLLIPSKCMENLLAYFQITTLSTRTSRISHYLASRVEVLLSQAKRLFVERQSAEGLEYCHVAAQYAKKYFENQNPIFYSSCLRQVGNVCLDFDAFPAALKLFGDALMAVYSTAGERDVSIGPIQQSLAKAYIGLGAYDNAENVLKYALDIYEKTEGEESSSFIECISALARVALLKQDFDAASTLTRRALALAERTTNLTGGSYLELADVSLGMKSVDQAASLYDKAIGAYRKDGDVHSKAYACAVEGLGSAKLLHGKKADAEGLLRIALAIYNHTFGIDSGSSEDVRRRLSKLLSEECTRDSFPDPTAQFFNFPGEFLTHIYHFAKMLRAAGHFDRSYGILLQLIQHCRSDRLHVRVLIQSLLEVAELFNRLGTTHAQIGQAGGHAFDAADVLVTEALQMLQAVGGASELEGFGRGEKPDRYLEKALTLRGLIATARGQHDEAYNFHAQASEIRKGWLINPSRYQGRAIDNIAACVATGRLEQALSALRGWALDDDKTLPNIDTGTSEDTRQSENTLLEYMREYHGLIEMALSYALCGESSPEGRETVMDILLRRRGVVADIMRMRALGNAAPVNSGAGAKGRSRDNVQEYRQWLSSVNARRVANALEPNSALVEYVRCRRVNFMAVTARGEARWTKPRYVALVLRAGRPDGIVALDLGEADIIAEQIREWLSHMRKDGRHVQPLGAPSGAGDSLKRKGYSDATSIEHVGALLREQLLDPIRSVVGPNTKLVIAAEDDLCMVPLQALPGQATGFVVEEQQIRYVTTGRDLVREGFASDLEPSPSVVVADPDYNYTADIEGSNDSEGSNSEDGGRIEPNVGSFVRIPGTRREGEYVAKLLEVEPWLGPDATKERVMGLNSPSVLHFATHGFFMPAEAAKGSGSVESMRRSGLALAGANVQTDRGVLTAEDAMGLRLTGTDLVVLSACETGVGDTRMGEGVFGLRRAFLIAGARSLIVSLWRVPDDETSELMSELYRQILLGSSVVEALEMAQEKVRQNRPHPYFWGSFICVGEGSPIALRKPRDTH